MNGIIKDQSRSATPSSHLGKRKRSASPEKPHVNGIAQQPEFNVDNVIRDIRKHGAATSILQHSLPTDSASRPATKKQRIDANDNTIEGRIALDWYSTTDSLLADVRLVIDEVKRLSPHVHGDHSNTADGLHAIEHVLSKYSSISNVKAKPVHALPVTGQILSVRSNVEGGGAKQLFTGSRIQPSSRVELKDIDIRELPSGFDVVEAAPLDTTQKPVANDARTVGDVFRQHRNARQLELPKPAKGLPYDVLRFQKYLQNTPFDTRDDYRLSALSAGSWLEYQSTSTEPSTTGSQPARAATGDAEALFNASFSSFAPTEDNTTAIISRSDRARLWYRKHGTQAMHMLSAVAGTEESCDVEYPDIDDDYQQLIDNYIPFEDDVIQPAPYAELSDADDLLGEVAELLRELSSYQNIRDLDKNRVPSAIVTPAEPEVSTFEVLRQQLKLLISALPPYAIAKLDGEQLQALDVSPNIVVETPEISGTGQPDEGTLHRQRMLLQQQAATTRPNNPAPTRNSYITATNTPTANYNTQTRTYQPVSQTPSMPGYAQKNVPMYNTPRPNAAPSTSSYNQNQNYNRPQAYPGATIQQYQRLQNGQPQNAQTPYQQRAAQTPYQPQTQMQNNITYATGASSAKPMTNGQAYAQQTPQPQRNNYSTPTPSTSLLSGPYAQANAHATIQQLKAHQSQSRSPQPQPTQANNAAFNAQQQRQASGTPQPQISQNAGLQTQAGLAALAGASNTLLSQAANTVQRSSMTPQPVQPAGVNTARA